MAVPVKRGGPAWYLWAVLAVTSVVGPAMAVKVSADRTDRAVRDTRVAVEEAQRESDLVWCGVVTVLDDGYRDPAPGSPPLTERGKRIAEGIAAVRLKYDCPPN